MSCETTCTSCALRPQLNQLGLKVGEHERVVALAGNPNTGKSTIFNALTGLRQHTGNWPGKTVTRAEGGFRFDGVAYKLVDLPGTYSLLSASVDEEVARDFILFGRPDCTVVVVDANALQRNLNLALQVLEITDRVVVCVNLMDEAERKGLQVDFEYLSRELGVPVVGTAARRRRGLEELLQVIADVSSGAVITQVSPHPTPAALREVVDELLPLIEEAAPGLPNARWVAYRLIEGDHRLRGAIESGELAEMAASSSSRVSERIANRVVQLTVERESA